MSRVKKPAVGANVLKYCRENERMASMENSQRQYVMVKAEAKWHEKQGQLLISGRMAKDRAMDEMKVELSCQQMELLISRSQRMKELYAKEGEMYERELNSLGLASASNIEDQF